jgi:uncharacterized membrane protein YdjX (TVP38/TMEM64 family)
MAVWYRARMTGWSARVAIATAVVAVALVAMVPVALFAGVIIMLLGHVVAGLALFGASILAAGTAVVIAGFSGVQHVRKLISQQRQRVVQLRRGEYYYD